MSFVHISLAEEAEKNSTFCQAAVGISSIIQDGYPSIVCRASYELLQKNLAVPLACTSSDTLESPGTFLISQESCVALEPPALTNRGLHFVTGKDQFSCHRRL